MTRAITVWILLMLSGIASGQVPAFSSARGPLRITVDAKHGEFKADEGRVTLRGAVRVTVQVPAVSAGQATVCSDWLEADLLRGQIRVPSGGRIGLGESEIYGDAIDVDARNDWFSLVGARGAVPLAAGAEYCAHGRLTAYFRAGSVTRRGNSVTLSNARVTTCDREHPHYYVDTDRVEYDLASRMLTVRDASLNLYGLRIPLLPWARFRVPDPHAEGEGSDLFNAPGYSKREGIYLPSRFRLTPPGAPWWVAGRFRVTQHQGLTGSAFAKRTTGGWDLEARVSRREWVPDDLEDTLGLSRLPELQASRTVSGKAWGLDALRVSLRVGNLREDLASLRPGRPPRPRVSAVRALAGLAYVGNADAQARRCGTWKGGAFRVSTYSTGETYGDLELFAGAGGDLSKSLSGYATLRHHFTTGSTPFLHDDVDIRSELEAGASLRVSRNWTLQGWGRYDLDKGRARDYEVGLSRRVHCLEWGIYYRDVGDQVGIRVDLVGTERSLQGVCPSVVDEKRACPTQVERGPEADADTQPGGSWGSAPGTAGGGEVK